MQWAGSEGQVTGRISSGAVARWGCTGAEPPCERFPVVVFVTGNLGYRQSNTVQVEELASHGFVVVAFDQPGTASSVLFPDGRRVPYAGRDVLKPLIDQSIEAVEPAPELAGTPYPDGIASYLAADGRAVLDHLATLDADPASPLAGRLDLDRVGAFGISLGGYTVSQWCATDPRLDACLFMDASMTLDARAQGLDAPALWLTRTAEDMAAEGWPSVEVRHFDGTQRALFAETRAPAWYVTVAGRLHNDFTDAPYGSPVLSWMGLTSAADPDETHAIMRGTTLAFFDHALRGGPPGVLDAPPWPGVEVVSHGTP